MSRPTTCIVSFRTWPDFTARCSRPRAGSRERHARTVGEGQGMETSKAEPLDAAAATLNHLIRLMQDCGLRDTAHFLAMAKTQFLIELNGISDSEFRALCEWLEG